ncbi:hypothetical protein Pcac1_g25655 [Phytophthora cactorum]|nr:hypothetical protein Pcac1_g25655 [Phytophthora cactorum]
MCTAAAPTALGTSIADSTRGGESLGDGEVGRRDCEI